MVDRPGEHCGDVVVGTGADHGVRRVREVTGAGAEQVGRRLPTGAQPPRHVVDQHVLGSETPAQRVEQLVRQRRRRDRHVVESGCLGDAERQLDQAASGLGKGGGRSRVAPALGVHLDLLRHVRHVLQCDT